MGFVFRGVIVFYSEVSLGFQRCHCVTWCHCVSRCSKVSGVNSVKGPGGFSSVTVSPCYCVTVLLGVVVSLGV